MKRGNFLYLTVLLLVLCNFINSPALAENVAVEFQWQTWESKIGGIKEWGNVIPETGINHLRHTAKNEIYNVVNKCGVGKTNYELIKSYKIDFNGDGKTDIILDPNAYFAQGVSDTCPFSFFNGSGGHLTGLYMLVSETQNISAAPLIPSPFFDEEDEEDKNATSGSGTETSTALEKTATKSSTTLFNNYSSKTKWIPAQKCPDRPENNTGCLSYCSATSAQCPELFTYNMRVLGGVSEYVNDWSFISVNTYKAFRARAVEPTTGLYLYRQPYKASVPIYVVHTSLNRCTNEELLVNGGRCVKYYQYVTEKIDGFADLYSPPALPNKPENDTRMTTRAFSRLEDKMKTETDYVSSWRRDGAKFDGKSALSFQIGNYTDVSKPNAPAKMICKQYSNTSGNDYFIPTNSDEELKAFMDSVAAGAVPGITGTDCPKAFTPWIGYTSCNQVSVRCDSTLTIAAERRCMRSSSAYGDCSECSSVADPAPVGGKSNVCFVSQTCYGSPCPRASGDCLPANTKILMADKRSKNIKDIKPGDMVMAFDAGASSDDLLPAKVKTLNVTDDRELMSVNGISMTENHRVVLKDGGSMLAQDLKVGDVLAGENGEPIEVNKVVRTGKKGKVYNFEIEGMRGYIANGLRVIASEPVGE